MKSLCYWFMKSLTFRTKCNDHYEIKRIFTQLVDDVLLSSYSIQWVSSFQCHLYFIFLWDNGFSWCKSKHRCITIWEHLDDLHNHVNWEPYFGKSGLRAFWRQLYMLFIHAAPVHMVPIHWSQEASISLIPQQRQQCSVHNATKLLASARSEQGEQCSKHNMTKLLASARSKQGYSAQCTMWQSF